MIYSLSDDALKEKGAIITAREIEQQPRLWEETWGIYQDSREKITQFFENVTQAHEHVQVIFTGAGTSAYVGNTILPYLKGQVDETQWTLSSVATTDLVSNPREYFNPALPTLLVSYARSGNSPESVAAVELGKQLVSDFYQVTITCAADGELARNAHGDERNLLLVMPEDSNDKGFAMTGSYSCMTLMTLLVFDTTSEKDKEEYLNVMIELGKGVIANEESIAKILEVPFNRVVYLGSGSLSGLTREAQLKILELTAGKVATVFDSSMGFRHGPKSFVDSETLIFGFVSNQPYTAQYDEDILEEIHQDGIAAGVIGLTTNELKTYTGHTFDYKEAGRVLPDAYLALPYVMFAQTVAILTAIKVGNTPDTPSPTGTVNRVVKGVQIYPYQA